MKSQTLMKQAGWVRNEKPMNNFIDPKDRPRVYLADGTEVRPIHGLKLILKKSKRIAPEIGQRRKKQSSR